MKLITRFVLFLAAPVAVAAGPDTGLPGNDELRLMIEQVVETHPDAQAARAQVVAARTELGGSRWARFPNLAVEAFSGELGDSSPDAALVLEQPLWSGGRISADIRRSEARLAAAVAARDEVYLDLALRTADAYTRVQALLRRAEVLEASLAEHRRLVDSMRRRVEQEISPESELLLAESRAMQIEGDVVEAQAQAEMQLQTLQQLTGDPALRIVGSLALAEEPLPYTAAELVDAAIAFNPSRRRLVAEAQVAGADVALARSELLPEIGLRYVHSMGDDDIRDNQVGVAFRLQTGGGLSKVRSIGAARDRERAAEMAIEGAIRASREAVLNTLSASRAAELRTHAGRAAAAAAQSVTESFLRQFAAGRRTWPEVLNAVRETVTAELVRIDAEAAVIGSRLRLMLLTGQWQPWGSEMTGVGS